MARALTGGTSRRGDRSQEPTSRPREHSWSTLRFLSPDGYRLTAHLFTPGVSTARFSRVSPIRLDIIRLPVPGICSRLLSPLSCRDGRDSSRHTRLTRVPSGHSHYGHMSFGTRQRSVRSGRAFGSSRAHCHVPDHCLRRAFRVNRARDNAQRARFHLFHHPSVCAGQLLATPVCLLC